MADSTADLPNPFASSPSSSPAPSRPISPNPAGNVPGINPTSSRFSSPTPSRGPGSQISAASGSPPPTHRASFPDPSKEPKKGSSRLSGPSAKQGFCCERDKDISKGEEIHIIDAFKTTDGGKATYITYVIRIGVSPASRLVLTNDEADVIDS